MAVIYIAGQTVTGSESDYHPTRKAEDYTELTYFLFCSGFGGYGTLVYTWVCFGIVNGLKSSFSMRHISFLFHSLKFVNTFLYFDLL